MSHNLEPSEPESDLAATPLEELGEGPEMEPAPPSALRPTDAMTSLGCMLAALLATAPATILIFGFLINLGLLIALVLFTVVMATSQLRGMSLGARTIIWCVPVCGAWLLLHSSGGITPRMTLPILVFLFEIYFGMQILKTLVYWRESPQNFSSQLSIFDMLMLVAAIAIMIAFLRFVCLELTDFHLGDPYSQRNNLYVNREVIELIINSLAIGAQVALAAWPLVSREPIGKVWICSGIASVIFAMVFAIAHVLYLLSWEPQHGFKLLPVVIVVFCLTIALVILWFFVFWIMVLVRQVLQLIGEVPTS
ncbi:hypothetical protein AB1L30_13975 [Bremerella sp. JC817]|uniref:hypothetical protein n=1 Tax=Bremerella sp. JC817 TaxID=3231756 RepID=UPI0034594B8E